jgi:hypothetical protein
MKRYIQKLSSFFERDKDISFYDEYEYICITLKELVGVIRTRNK